MAEYGTYSNRPQLSVNDLKWKIYKMEERHKKLKKRFDRLEALVASLSLAEMVEPAKSNPDA